MLAMPASQQRGRPIRAPFLCFAALAVVACKGRAQPSEKTEDAPEAVPTGDGDPVDSAYLESLLPGPVLDWPVDDVHITSYFEWRSDPLGGGARMHRGIDLRGDVGDPVYSVGPGRVSTSSYDATLGHHVVVDHADGMQSLYAHLEARTVFAGVPVSRGSTLGRLGNTGRSEAPHLHLTIRVDGVAIDPLTVLRAPQHAPNLMAQPLYEPPPSETETGD